MHACLSLFAAGVTQSQAAQLGLGELLDLAPNEEVTSFLTLPNGVRGLFQAALRKEGLFEHIKFNSPVSTVANDGTVTGPHAYGPDYFDHVIVTVRPEAAYNMLSPPLQQVYKNGETGLVDTLIFNATVVPNAPMAANLSGLLTTISQNCNDFPELQSLSHCVPHQTRCRAANVPSCGIICDSSGNCNTEFGACYCCVARNATRDRLPLTARYWTCLSLSQLLTSGFHSHHSWQNQQNWKF